MPAGMTLRELLVASSPAHRSAVAAALDLPDAGAAGLARAVHDEHRLAALVGGLAPVAAAAVTALAFDDSAQAFPGGLPGEAALAELERHGLAFAFAAGWSRRWAMPEDLRPPLRRLRAEAHARPLARGAQAKARRLVGVPRQCGHDAAAVWAYLARAPVRVKADGQLYARAWPKLVDALPPIPGVEATGFGEMRVDFALDYLRAGGFLRLRGGARPGQEARRELVADGDLPGALERDPDAAGERLARQLERGPHGIAAALARALNARTVGLEPFAAGLRGLLDEAGLDAWGGRSDAVLTLSALGPLWLAGAVQLGVDAHGEPVAVHLAPAPRERTEGPLGVCQSSFEVICLRPPEPAERALLVLAAEPVDGQAHVFRITRASARSLAQALGRDRASGALAALIGALPQNVERSMTDWVAGVRPALRMRSALFVDVPDAETADALASGPLAGLVVERLGDRRLAVGSESLRAVEGALRQAGHELEPGLDRISGAWLDRHDDLGEARAGWARGDHEPPPIEAPGRLVSTLTERTAPRRTAADRGLVVQAESLAAVLAAIEEDADLDIVYAGKRGVTHRRITPFEIQGAALHAWCHLRDDERAFWLASIRHATPVHD
jgi:hypothetical protein